MRNFQCLFILPMIVQAHVEYETAKRHYAHVDCPGHADYVKVSCERFLLYLGTLAFIIAKQLYCV